MMLVLFFTNAHAFTVYHRKPLVNGFTARGWKVAALAPGSSPGFDAFRAQGVEVAPVTMTRAGFAPFRETVGFLSIILFFRRKKPDLIVNATVKPLIYGTLAAWLTRTPVINLVTGLGYLFTDKGTKASFLRVIVRTVYRFLFRYRNQRVIFQNRDDMRVIQSFAGLGSRRFRLVPGSGVDTKAFSPCEHSPRAELQVVFVGRMLYDKGVQHFVESAIALRRQHPSARFLLVGPTDYGNPSGIPESRLSFWAQSGIVVWCGTVDDMQSVYRAADVVVLPSRREGMPKVVLEAAASGLPVVTTDVPGCRDSVIHGESGFLVPWGNVEELSARIGQLLSDSGLRQKMGRNARKLAEERFSADVVVGKTYDIVMELL